MASLEGHVDAIECMRMKPGSLSEVVSGSWDGGEFIVLFLL